MQCSAVRLTPGPLDQDLLTIFSLFSIPGSQIVAAGCADHNVYIFDLRYTRGPLSAMSGHDKAVSYIKFLSPTEVVSASTDSSLKLWSVQPITGRTGDDRGEMVRVCVCV